VRKLIALTLASTAIVAVACSKQAPDTAMSADLKADLKLASTTQDIRINPDELTPTSKPAPATRVRKAASGPKVVRTEKPTVLASATPTEEADIPTEVPDVQAMAPAPAPAETPSPSDAPPLARPSAIPATNAGGQAAGAGAGRGDSGMGGGSVWGGVFGAVIRGGVVGDDDHCDPRSMPGRRRPVSDIYGGGIAGGGGMRGVPSGIGGRRRF
jgi:hypothetical protein